MGSSTKVPKIDVQKSPTRCPYCHDDVDPRAERWVVCAGCLARHHDECWQESQCCATCGIEGRLEPVFGPEGAKTRARAKPAKSDPKKDAKSESAAPPATARIWPTLVVAKRGGDDVFRTIGDAIAAARPGTRILVTPGTYNEGIVIDRAVAIVGDGPRAEIVVASAESDCIVMETDRALVQGLTLRVLAGTSTRFSAVRIDRGQLRLWDCDVASQTPAPCIVVAGPYAEPSIRRCRIHDGKGGGIAFEANAAGSVEACEISANRQFGIGVRTGARPKISATTIERNGTGVFVSDNGLGEIESCDVARNDEAGIRITTGGNPIVKETKVRDGRGDGVVFSESGEGTLEGCTISANARDGVRIERESRPRIVWTKIEKNRGNGVSVVAHGAGAIEHATIFENGQNGVETSMGGRPRLASCRIRRNDRAGVRAGVNGRGSIEACDLGDNARGPIELDPTGAIDRILS